MSTVEMFNNGSGWTYSGTSGTYYSYPSYPLTKRVDSPFTVTTGAAEGMAGWTGIVRVGSRVVWETEDAFEDRADAVATADAHVVSVFSELLT